MLLIVLLPVAYAEVCLPSCLRAFKNPQFREWFLKVVSVKSAHIVYKRHVNKAMFPNTLQVCVFLLSFNKVTSFVDCVYFFKTNYMNQDTSVTRHLVRPIVSTTKLSMYSFSFAQLEYRARVNKCANTIT